MVYRQARARRVVTEDDTFVNIEEKKHMSKSLQYSEGRFQKEGVEK